MEVTGSVMCWYLGYMKKKETERGLLVQVRHRIFRKRIHVRVEHIRKSRCKEDFLERVHANEKLRAAAKEKGGKWMNGIQ